MYTCYTEMASTHEIVHHAEIAFIFKIPLSHKAYDIKMFGNVMFLVHLKLKQQYLGEYILDIWESA